MEYAIKEAQQAFEKKEVPVGAVVVFENKIVGKGHNMVETLQDPTAHAEIIAITSAATYLSNWRLLKSSLFVTSEPCLMCLGAVLHSRIETLVYGVDEPKFGAFSQFLLKPKKLKIIKGIKKEEILSLLKNFFTYLRK